MTRFSMPLALVAALLATPALADSAPRRSVALSDLNLTSYRGRAVLDARLVHAARTVCDVRRSRELARNMAASKCYKETIARARLAANAAIASRAGPAFDMASR